MGHPRAFAGLDYAANSGILTFPANVTAVRVNIVVFGDRTVEPDEHFGVQLSNPSDNALLVLDFAKGTILNDDFAGASGLNPSNVAIQVGEHLNLALTWTHPERWRLLDKIDLRILDDESSVIWVRFDERSNTFSLFNPESGRYENPVQPGSPQRLESNAATVYLADSLVQGSGSTGRSVTLTYNLSFKPRAAGRTFQVEAFAPMISAIGKALIRSGR